MLQLLKRSILCVRAAACFAVCFLLFSCQSAPPENEVNALDILDGNSAVYFAVPVQAHHDFVVEAVRSITGSDAKSAGAVVDRIKKMYIGINFDGSVQAACNGSFPSALAKFAFTEKKGWKTAVFREHVYFTQKSSLFQVAIPNSSTVCFSYTVAPMLERFDSYAGGVPGQLSGGIEERAYSFLSEESSADICVYTSAPKLFMQKILGVPLNVPVDSLSAVLFSVPDNSQFGMNIVIVLSDPRTVKAVSSALKIALFPVPVKIIQSGASQITVADITVDKRAILSFVR